MSPGRLQDPTRAQRRMRQSRQRNGDDPFSSPSVAEAGWLRLIDRSKKTSSLDATDRLNRVIGPFAVDVPEFLKVGAVEVGKFLARVGERGRELLGVRGLLDRFPQRQCD